jgi:oligopeptidase A
MNELKVYDFSTPPNEVEEKLNALLSEYRAFVETRLAQGSSYTRGNLILPIEELDARVDEVWSPFNHRNSVMNDAAAREIYARCKKLLSDFNTDMSQNAALLGAYEELAQTSLSDEQRKSVKNALRDFRLAGVHLPTEVKARYKEINQQLSVAETNFENNLTDAEDGWKKHVTDVTILAGLPESTIAEMKQAAEKAELPGYLVLLKQDKYRVIMQNASNRDLRREFYEAWFTKASDQGPNAGKWDNTSLYEEILALCHEKALLLGFKNYAELSLATKMAENTGEVMEFLKNLAERAKPFALREYEELSAFAKKRDGVETLELWDIGYYTDQLKKEKFGVSAQEIREYFPLSKVLPGMFKIVEKLYGIQLEECTDFVLWHKDAKFFKIFSKNGELLSGLYMDLYSRKNKRGGAWMDEAVSRRRMLDGEIVPPVAYLNHNIEAPVGDADALLSHDDVLTLFHEFGHTLHHMLTKAEVYAVSGIHGVEWDAVELPSQFMEGWCWTEEGLNLISGHYKTGAKLPHELFEKMLGARNFGQGLDTMRQLIFSIFDFRLYVEYSGEKAADVLLLYREVFEKLHPAPLEAWDRFPNTFAHIFAGGYGAGYYGYKWAEVLSVDVFSAFIQEDGATDWGVGAKFLEELLSRGGSRSSIENFIAFRGRKPSIEPLLKQNGFMK